MPLLSFALFHLDRDLIPPHQLSTTFMKLCLFASPTFRVGKRANVILTPSQPPLSTVYAATHPLAAHLANIS